MAWPARLGVPVGVVVTGLGCSMTRDTRLAVGIVAGLLGGVLLAIDMWQGWRT